MFRLSFFAWILSLFAALPALAFDIDAMSESEREAFRSEIRSYLLENPEVLMEAIAILENRRNQESQAADVAMLEDNRQDIFDDGYSFIGGNPDGDVTIVEFLDYRCGFCKRAFPAVQELIESDGNIRFIVKEFPILGEASELGSRYAIATKRIEGDAAYKTAHDAMMVLRGDLNGAALIRISEKNGFDHDAIVAEMESEEIKKIIASNRALGQKLKIQGTPSFIMGDNFVRGFVELDQMREIVQAVRQDES
ncbi:MAG: DsbA family protein [Boseongicola sp.]